MNSNGSFTAGLKAVSVQIKGGAGVLTHIQVINPNAALTYLQVFDKLSPTVGTDTPKLSYGIPNSAQVSVDSIRIQFNNAIVIAATTTSTGNTAPTTGVDVNLGYE